VSVVPTEKALALVIRQVDFSETSRVVTFFTREFGKVGALAKGGRRIKGPFAGALDLLSVCRIVLIRKSSDSLDLLTEAELVKGFKPDAVRPGHSPARSAGTPPRNSLQVLYAGYYVAELLLELTEDDDPHPLLFDMAVDCLGDLESSDDIALVLRRFELLLLRETGHMPNFEACAACGAAVGDESALWFSAASGGLVCRACAPAARGTVRLTAGAVKAIELLAEPGGVQWKRLRLTAGMQCELAAVTRGAILRLVGRELRTAQFLRDSPS
jgi:DNA repair protein RecO (recombination protein O)